MSMVKYRIVSTHGTTLVIGTLDVKDGIIMHDMQFPFLLRDKQRLLVCIKMGRIEDNYVALMDSGLSILMGAIMQRALAHVKLLKMNGNGA